MSEINITRASLSNLEQLVILFDAYRQFYQRPSDHLAARDFLQARLNQNQSVIFVAQDDSGALGFAQLYPIFSSVSLARAFLLNDLFVSEKARRKNVAASLLRASVNYARDEKAAWLTLSTATNNIAAQALYEREGWARENEFYVYNFNCTKS
jgi:ribosomal protein S18 acetylase RimI-like enzyme